MSMRNDKRKIKSQEIFDSLVKNAIDFLIRSVSELETNPKYSIINFCTAVELFLKSRLMLEHWSLIFDDPKQAHLDKFLQGDFKSVTMEGAIVRLKGIAALKFDKNEEECFKTIRNHRNQLVHFFNKAYSNESNAGELETVALEECKGWFYLSQLLREKWKDDFSDYTHEIEKLDKSMSGIRKYLQVKFDALLPEIEIKRKRGASFGVCTSCRFISSEEKILTEISQFSDHLLSSSCSCLVCGYKARNRELKVSCPDCENGKIGIHDLGEGECEDCEYLISLDELLDRFAKVNYLGSGEFEENRAYCSFCEYLDQPTVVPFEKIWLCLSCLEHYDEVGWCEYCNEHVAGDLEDSFLSGCLMCEGQMGHYMNSRAYNRDD
jgi:hypothetical protein